jgi:hypothetical protein
MFRQFKVFVQENLLKKRLYQVAPELRPLPSPVGDEYMLAVLQYSRLIFTNSLTALAAERSGFRFWRGLARWAICYISLLTTTVIVRSILLERALMKRKESE